MILYANVFSDKDEESFGVGKVSGAHFHRENDPENPKNKVLRVSTWNTITNLPSTTHVAANKLSSSASCCEFRMKYRFDVIPWLFWPKYYTLELRAKNGTPIISITFSASDHNPEGGGTASKIAMSVNGGEKLESTTLAADKWYDLRVEYYPSKKQKSPSRVKIYANGIGEEYRLVYDGECEASSDEVTSAAIVHSATKIKGTQYFDDISFTITDKKYGSKADEPLQDERRVIYDFENGIPSGRDFNIEMQLKKGDERATFDPATWKSAGSHSGFKNSREFYEISLVLEGEGKFETDNGEYPFEKGSILVTAPGCNHTVTSAAGYKLLSVMGRFEKLGFIKSSYIIQDNIYNEGKKLAELILYNRFGNEDYVEALCDAYIKYIAINLGRAPKSTASAIYKIVGKMEKDFGKSDLSVGALLDESGYARDYIREEFFAVTKKTPKKYLNDIRMKNAKAMIDLYGSELSLGEIGERCGILDSSVFSRIFRKHFGISPSDYKHSR